jgi:hypothetical protein
MAERAASEYYQLVEINDRTFQNYSIQNNVYPVPVDEVCTDLMSVYDVSARGCLSLAISLFLLTYPQEEEERLIAQHHLFLDIFDGRLFFPPLQYPRRILDLGYGRGNWAVTMAQTYHDSEVRTFTLFLPFPTMINSRS